jgi:hypothetical protein
LNVERIKVFVSTIALVGDETILGATGCRQLS